MSTLNFEISSQIHATSASRVFEAVDGDRSRCLIELLDTCGTGPWVDAFRQDMAVLAELDHPGMLRVLDIGTMADGTPVIVSERPDGITLTSFLEEGRLFSLGAAIDLLAGIASALDAAHAAGVSHGAMTADDVVLVERDDQAIGSPRVRGFGHRWLRAAVAYGNAPVMVPGPGERPVPAPAREITADIAALAALAEQLLGPLFRGAKLSAVLRAGRAASRERFPSARSLVEALGQALPDDGADLTDPLAPAPQRSFRQAMRRVLVTAVLTVVTAAALHALATRRAPATTAATPAPPRAPARAMMSALEVAPRRDPVASPRSDAAGTPRAGRTTPRPRPARLWRVWSDQANQVVLVDDAGHPAGR